MCVSSESPQPLLLSKYASHVMTEAGKCIYIYFMNKSTKMQDSRFNFSRVILEDNGKESSQLERC